MISKASQLLDRVKAGMVTRLHTQQTIADYTVANHTFNMLLLADWMYYGKPSLNLMRAILYHDLHELHTGDIPHPVKQIPFLKGPIEKYETEINSLMETTPPTLSPEEQQALQLIDLQELIMFISNEKELGNQTLNHIFDNARELYEELTKE